MNRQCRVCLVEKPLEAFPKAAHGKDGRRNQCTECRKAYHRTNSKLHYVKTRTSKLEKVKAYAAEHVDEIKLQKAAYARTEAYRIKDRERNRLRRADKSGHPHRAFLSRRYLARKHNAPGFTTKLQLQARWDYYGHKCWICSEAAKETDHVKPISKGGTNWPANLRPICSFCNRSKGNNWPYIPTKQVMEIK